MTPTPRDGEERDPEDGADHGSASSSPEALDVLVVDDDPESRAALGDAIAGLGHRCRSAASGQEGLDSHRQDPADVIVSDWSMPGMDGLELCRRVRELRHRAYTYVLFTSGHAHKRDFVEAVRAGADDYLTKPIDLDELEARLIAAARVVGAYRRLAERNLVLRHDSQASFIAARVDPLTQIGNRLALEEDLASLPDHLVQAGGRATLAMCDIDGFKAYNDQCGHPAGDDALRTIAHAIRASLRRGDRVYRYGGEEFLVVLGEQRAADARAAMERVRAAVEDLAIVHAVASRRPVLTVSIGMALARPSGAGSVKEAIARADAALYRAKGAGGNTVRRAPGVG